MTERLLLDTHAAVWLMEKRLDEASLEVVISAGVGGNVFVSPITAWEIAMLSRPGNTRAPLQFRQDPVDWFADLLALSFVRLAPCTPLILIESTRLPGAMHNDPADRLLVATARDLDAALMTRDAALLSYSAEGHLRTIAC